MHVAALTLELRIEHAQSLKDRRQVVRSLKEQLRRGFNVSVAEIDDGHLWQRAMLAVAAVSVSRDYLSGLMQQVDSAANRMALELGAEVADSYCEFQVAE